MTTKTAGTEIEGKTEAPNGERFMSDKTRQFVEPVRKMLAEGINVQALGETTNQTIEGAFRSLVEHIDELEMDLAALRTAVALAPPSDGSECGDLEEAVRLAEVGEYLFTANSFAYGDGYTEPRELGIHWEWQQSAPEQYGEGMLMAAATKWHDEQAEDDVVTEARKLRSALTSSPMIVDHTTQMDRDIGILLATIDWISEATGESPEGEDAAMVAQIKADHEARIAPPRPRKITGRSALRVDDVTRPE